MPHPNEAAFTAALSGALRQLGYLTYHTHRSDHSEAGFPDLLCVHPGTGAILALELKMPKGVATANQVRWIQAFSRNAQLSMVVRPADEQQLIAVAAELAGHRTVALAHIHDDLHTYRDGVCVHCGLVQPRTLVQAELAALREAATCHCGHPERSGMVHRVTRPCMGAGRD